LPGLKVTSRSDNFDLLRLLAALMVLWSHQYALLGVPEPSIVFFNSGLGLNIFFALSGYLNAKSILRTPAWWQFLFRRARRIYPGLLGAALFCAALGFAVTTSDAATFWTQVPKFIFKNVTILFGIDYKLPGVFEANPFPGAINGSLWTLHIEIKLYIYLAIIAVTVRYKPPIFLGVLLAVFVGLLIWFQITSGNVETSYTQKFAVVFVAGCLLAVLEHIKGSTFAALGVLGLAAVAWLCGGPASLLPGIALMIALLGKLKSPVWMRPPLDISYGVYLFAFPIQQVVASFGLSLWPSLGLSLISTLACAVLSAICIEQPALGSPSKVTTNALASAPR
jgi:peptidoglycan/LPS O-acetylase OafA/YrhL